MTDTNSTGADRPSIPTSWREWRKARKPHEAKLAARRARDRVRWYAVIQPALIKAARAALDAVYHSPENLSNDTPAAVREQQTRVTCWHKADLDFFETGEPEDHSAPDFPLAYDERTAAWYAEHPEDDPPDPPFPAMFDDRSEAWLNQQWRASQLRNISTEQANIWYASRLRRRRAALAPFLADPPEPLTAADHAMTKRAKQTRLRMKIIAIEKSGQE